jgi:hypothetical protein
MPKKRSKPLDEGTPMSVKGDACGTADVFTSLVFVLRVTVVLVVIGSLMQGYANSTIAALPVGLLFLVFGCLVMGVVFPGKPSEMRAFMLTYAIYVLAGGLAQCYSLLVFHEPQNFSDAVYFLGQVSPMPPFKSLAEMQTEGSLAVATWQQVYAVTWWLGFKFGPYTGVILNALIMGLAGGLTVGTARALFGDDSWRLRRVGTLFAFCGLFILFGALLLRDSFVIFFNALWLWGAVRWLVRPSGRTLALAAILTTVSVYTMLLLREEAVVLIGLYAFLAALSWYCIRKLNASRMVVVVLVLCALPIAGSYLGVYTQQLQNTQTSGQEYYTLLSAADSKQDSLGMRLVVDQPLPIRMIVGTGALFVNPMPLWVNFKVGAQEYHLIKGYHGIFQVLVIPLGVAGIFVIVRLLRKKGRKAIPLLFLAVYALVNLVGVVASSGEQRHLGQFMEALLMLAALPDTRDKWERRRLRIIASLWFGVVILLHVLWAGMK